MKKFLLIFLSAFVVSTSFGQFKYCDEDLFPAKGDNRQWGFRNLFGEWKVLPLYTKTYRFYGATAIVQQGLKYGVIDCFGKMVLAPEYDEIKNFIAGVAWVRSGDLWGLINENGKVVLAPKFKEVVDVGKFSDIAWIRKGEKWGVFDKFQLKWIYEPHFRVYKILSREYALVKEDGKFGIINCSDSVPVYEPQFSNVAKIAPYKLAVKLGDAWGVIKDNGTLLIPIEYDTITRLSKVKLVVEKNGLKGIVDFRGRKLTKKIYTELDFYENKRALCKRDGKYGFLDYKGREVIPCIYDRAGAFANNVAIVSEGSRQLLIDVYGEVKVQSSQILRFTNHDLLALYENKWAIHDFDGVAINDEQFDNIVTDDPTKGIRIKSAGKWYLFDPIYKTKSSAFDSILAPYAGNYVVKSNGYYGLIDTDGKLTVRAKYEKLAYAGLFENKQCYYFSLGNIKGLVSIGSREVVSGEYQSIKIVGEGVIVSSKEKFGLLSGKEKTVLKPKYDQILSFAGNSNELAFLKKGKYALANIKGKLLSEFAFENINALGADYFVITKGGKVGVVNKIGTIVFAPIYDSIRYFDGKYFCMEKDGKLGFVDRKGRLVIKPKFDDTRMFVDDIAVAQVNGEWGAINRRGAWIVEPRYGLAHGKNCNYLLVGGDRDFEVTGVVVEILKY